MFAYCGNNPVSMADKFGTYADAIPQSISWLSGFASASTFLASSNFWNPVGWIFGGIAVIAIAWVAVDSYTTVANPSISVPYVETKSAEAEQEKEKDIVKYKPRKDPIHHIVAKADPRASKAREILWGVGINPLTDSRNLMQLPQRYHARLHTNGYYNFVNEKLRLAAGDIKKVEFALVMIRVEINSRVAAGIRWD